MAKSAIEHPVEFYELKAPKNGACVMVGLPFYAFKVFAPPPIKREVNMFQLAILGIMQVGSYSTEEIASYVKLDRDLVLLIQAELTSMQLVTGDGSVTPKGRKVLHHESWDLANDLEDFTVGYIYQDPISKKFLPRFNAIRNFTEIVIRGENQETEIVAGTKGAPKNHTISLHDGESFDEPPRSPGTKEIFEVIRKHALAADFPDSDLVTLNPKAKPPIGLKKISLLDDEPHRTWLATYVVAPENSSSLQDWRVLDPFGLGESNGMKSIVEAHLKRDKELAKRIERLLYKQRENWKAKHLETREELIRQSELAIQEGLGLCNLSDLMEEQLLEFEFQFQEFLIVGERNSMPIVGQKVLETMMREIADMDRGIFGRVRRRMTASRHFDEMYIILESAAIAAGASEFPHIFARSKPQQIAAWPWNPVSLRPMVAATLIGAHDRPSHPFTKMIREEPQLLRFIADASMLRDAGAHGGESDSDERRFYDQMHQEIFHIIRTFIKATNK